MYYCENCHLLSEEPICDYCGSSDLRQPQADDFCYLTTRTTPWYEILLDVLYDNGIPWVVRPVRPTAVTVYLGMAAERNEIFVPFSKLEQARELEASVFQADTVVEEE